MRDAEWLVAEIEAWTAALGGAVDVQTSRDDRGLRQRITGRGTHPLSIELRVTDDAIEVALGDWTQSFETDDDAVGEAAELVAAALFGRARAELERVDEDWARFELQFRVGERWSTFATMRRGRLAFWRKTIRVHLVNDLVPPADLELGECGRLPTAPWIGMLHDAHGEAPARELELDGELDLHPFAPKEVAQVVREYIDACRERGVLELRLVHGKGIGNLRRTVHSLLAAHPAVASYRLGGHGEGSWGATLVTLKPA